ncbi:hypothetical protein BKA70DRAFT_409548 [Coprinopsis sp. MPI-PUGE-AT-0042]|nr:hypothetical protein BKA70DRAFT_409548 [Coprinopsis sp. MPI-PUGE-AT-0042]
MPSSLSSKPSFSANDSLYEDPVVTQQSHFFQETVVFQVENVLYRVARERFEAFSPVFRDMFAMPPPAPRAETGERYTVEGQSLESPIVLEGYKTVDFERLLTLLYPRGDSLPGELPPLHTKEDWTSILKLASAWEMEKIRSLAISKLAWVGLTSMEKIRLGREYRVANWFSEGVSELALSRDMTASYSIDDLAQTLGWETAARILWIRTSMLDSSAWGAVDVRHLTCARTDCNQPIQSISLFGQTLSVGCCAGHPSVRSAVAAPGLLGGFAVASRPVVRFKLSNVLTEGPLGLAPPQHAGISKIFEEELRALS